MLSLKWSLKQPPPSRRVGRWTGVCSSKVEKKKVPSTSKERRNLKGWVVPACANAKKEVWEGSTHQLPSTSLHQPRPRLWLLAGSRSRTVGYMWSGQSLSESESPSLWSARWPGLILFLRKWLKGFCVGDGERTAPLLGLRACLTFRAKDHRCRLAIWCGG